MGKGTPTVLFFSRQQSFCIWDDTAVLDAMEQELKGKNETYKRNPPNEAHELGHLDIFCSHEDIAQRYRELHQIIRGTV